MAETIERPGFVTDEMLHYLDNARERGISIGYAQRYIKELHGLSYAQADAVALYWIRTFTERHAAKTNL